jgi:phosphoribosyl-AMP cyclohydrolase
METKKNIEEGKDFLPKFNSDGLITAISQDARTGEILMVANMNRQALEETVSSGRAVFYSRSRKKLWRKGEQSGHFQKVVEILTDCDQDCIVLKVQVDQGQCHVGYQSCFYRRLNKDGELETIAQKCYDPAETYGK